MKRSNYLNKKVFKLTVIQELIPNNGNNKQGKWLCLCECGKTIEVWGLQLYSRKSCGCLTKEVALTRAYGQRSYDTVTIRSEYQNHRGNAKQRGHKFLPFEQWIKIVKMPCFYCGEIDVRNRADMDSYKALRGLTLKDGDIEKYAVKMNGVDRVDSLLGYEVGNSVSCCSMCNRMKNNFPMGDFIDKISKIYRNIKAMGLKQYSRPERSGEPAETRRLRRSKK